MVGAPKEIGGQGHPLVGIDLTAGPSRPSALAASDDTLQVVHLGGYRGDAELASAVAPLAPRVIAIDAPLFLPKGLCCLEESCPCLQAFPNPGRQAERALSHLGISSYYTTKRTFIKPLIYRGIALRQRWENQGFTVIEVYPYATKVRLFGRRLPKKNKPSGRKFFAERLKELFPNLTEIAPLPGHDQADALIAAYTAFLFAWGKTEALGDLEEGWMHIPRVEGG